MPPIDGGGAVAIVARTLEAAIDTHRRVRGLDLTAVATAASTIASALGSGRKVLAFGNGGSAGDAQHLVAELVGRFQKERAGFAAVALTADTSLLTSVANDDGGDAGRLAEVHVNVPDGCTARVQEVHITLIHAICEIVETGVTSGN